VSGRILIDVTDLLSLGAGDPQLDSDMRRELADLADELNSNLDGYEVMLVHYDTGDFLSFEKRDQADDGDFWAAEQAEREAIVADLFAEGEAPGPDPAQIDYKARASELLSKSTLSPEDCQKILTAEGVPPGEWQRLCRVLGTWFVFPATPAEGGPDPIHEVTSGHVKGE